VTEYQYFFLTLVLILNSLAIIMVGLTQHYQTKSINALTEGLTRLVNAITKKGP